MKIVGIDLAGVETRETGFCILNEKMEAKTFLVYTDGEILKNIEKIKPDLVVIDAPLALPKGRPSLSKKYKKLGHLRECDKKLLKMGIKFFPITLGPMRKLTLRGIRIKKRLEKKGFKVFESFPGAIQDILKMPRKNKGKEKLRKALIEFEIKGDVYKKKITHHELDAITLAIVGKMYLENKYMLIGDPKEVLMLLPKK